MNIIKYVPKTVTRAIGRSTLKTAKHSPTILFAAGVIGVGATVVLACKATLRLDEEVLTPHEKMMTQHDEIVYWVNDRAEMQQRLYLLSLTVSRAVKLYGPAIVVGSLSVIALGGSHRIMRNRVAGLTAAYGILQRSYDEYRSRVVEELGAEADKKFRFGSVEHKIVEEGANGPETKWVSGPADASEYARVFAESNRNWQATPQLNRLFLEAMEAAATTQLNAYGYLLLNDVYQMLGFERTKAGCVVGWLREGKDGYVDFGYGDWPRAADWVRGSETGVMLDFNVDGIVYDKI